jgi:hypothetical protein
MSYDLWMFVPRPGMTAAEVKAFYEEEDAFDREDEIVDRRLSDEAIGRLALKPFLRHWLDPDATSEAMQAYLARPEPEPLPEELAEAHAEDLSWYGDLICEGRINLMVTFGAAERAFALAQGMIEDLREHGFVGYDPQLDCVLE